MAEASSEAGAVGAVGAAVVGAPGVAGREQGKATVAAPDRTTVAHSGGAGGMTVRFDDCGLTMTMMTL